MSKPAAWCLLAAALFGASTPAAKLLLQDSGPLLLSGILYFGAALAVLPALPLRRRATVTRANVWRLVGAVLFGGVVGPVLMLCGLSYASAGAVSLWLTMETVLSAPQSLCGVVK